MTVGRNRAVPSLFDMARASGVVFSREAVPLDRFVTANGMRFHYLDWGSADGPPVLLLHGFAQTCHTWDFAALWLSERHRVIALDQRGHGDSEWAPDGDYSPEAHQGDLRAIVDTLGLRNIVLVGLSMGGRNAFIYTAEHPERVRGLVIVEAAPQHQRSGAESVKRFVEAPDELDSIDEFVTRAHKYSRRRSLDQLRSSMPNNLKRLPNGKWTWKYDRVFRSPDRPAPAGPEITRRLWGYIDRITCPTLLVRGADSDVVSQETAEAMRGRIGGSRLAVIEGAGHLVPGDSPSGFQGAVSEFLAGLE